MFSLEDLLGRETGGQAVGQISANLGADPGTVNSAIQMALPVILSGLANNAQSPSGAQSLDQALATDHDGGLLNNLTDFLTGGVPSPQQATRQTDGTGILGHILGTNQGTAAQEISRKTGLNIGQVANLLITLAPIVMAYLGKQKQEKNLDAGGISDLLTGQRQEMQSSGNPMIDMASRMLDSDGDGSALDDLASMAAGYFMK
ncbi:MAG: DUF937 domain-containing protein [Acidobacteriota bacterium]|nr:DUF937 domain-containing protein [Acidobacteriota bacterium]MDH3529618.1 DUF937 domain-containing protein [Acidobacteriota bacterium]